MNFSPQQKHYYQPMFTLIGGGMKTLKDSWHSMESCITPKAKWIRDSAAAFDPQNNEVITANGDKIEYDFMIVAVGVETKYDQIPGLLDALSEPNGPVCSNYSPIYVDRTYAAFQAFKEGNAIFTFPNSPVKCPGAPQKIMYIFEHFTRRTGIRNKANIMYNTSLPVIFGVKHYADALNKVCKERNITVNTRTNLIEVRPGKREAVFQNLDKPEEKTTTNVSFCSFGAFTH